MPKVKRVEAEPAVIFALHGAEVRFDAAGEADVTPELAEFFAQIPGYVVVVEEPQEQEEPQEKVEEQTRRRGRPRTGEQ